VKTWRWLFLHNNLALWSIIDKPLMSSEAIMCTNKAVVYFRGRKTEFGISSVLTVGHVKVKVASSVDHSTQLDPSNIKLMFKGKVLSNDEEIMVTIVGDNEKSAKKKIYRFMATGMSGAEQAANKEQFEAGLKTAPRIRDDLTQAGQREMNRLNRLGRNALRQAAARSSGLQQGEKYGFGKVETLPNLLDEAQAREILTTLSSDPGVLACMAKNKWNVGSLAELYPEGKVGESAVCVMGLNKNKGQQILLRLRTDDLRGFRKMLSIRKVLFHELAHNVHSEHNQDFFQLMRQIERECNEMDWTQGSGLSEMKLDTAYETGSYRLGGGTNTNMSARELAAMAATTRITAEELEIYDNCGCGAEAKFLPSGKSSSNTE
jgi:hypothetical protein